MSIDENVRRLERREASSGKVSYSDPVVLHETKRTRVVMVPFFIPHSTEPQLAIKIITYRKADPPEQWFAVEEKSISLQEAAARRLFNALREHLALAKEPSDGSYILLPVHGGVAQIGEHQPSEVASALLKVLGRGDIVGHLEGLDLGSELAEALRGSIRLSEMRAAVAQLRELLDSGEGEESAYQRWCSAHTWAFGSAYVMRDDIREISPGDHLDLLLPTVISGHRDIVELKRPDMVVLLKDDAHRNYYFSAPVSKAIGQCHRYLDVLHEEAAKGLRDHPEIVAYHPRATVVIGRSCTWPEEAVKALHGLNRRLNGIAVMTYDQLLAQGERLLQMVAPAAPAAAVAVEGGELETFSQDDQSPW
jgi:hypothetical protein